MKKINILIFVIASTLLVACSESLESKAKKRVQPITEILVDDPNSLIIQDEEVVLTNDSLCVIQYLAKSKNNQGGYATTEMEYFLIHCKDREDSTKYALYEMAYPLNEYRDYGNEGSVTAAAEFKKMMTSYVTEYGDGEQELLEELNNVLQMSDEGLIYELASMRCDASLLKLSTAHTKARKVE